MEIIVAKFGGTSIGNGERIKLAARSVVKEYMKGNKVVVVVSAINKTTDDITKMVEDSMGKSVTEKQMADIISMGEITSIRLFSSTIESLGVKSTYLDPHMEKPPYGNKGYLLILRHSKFSPKQKTKKKTDNHYKSNQTEIERNKDISISLIHKLILFLNQRYLFT